jgi:hypothetical protein
MLFWSFVTVLQVVLSSVVDVTAASQMAEMLEMMETLRIQ